MEEVRNWLKGLGLEQYAPKFEEEGWDTLDILKHMKPSEIENVISKPGHRRKFEIGLKAQPPTGEVPKALVKEDRTLEPIRGAQHVSQTRKSCQKRFAAGEPQEEITTPIHETKSFQQGTDGQIANVSRLKNVDEMKLDNECEVLSGQIVSQDAKKNAPYADEKSNQDDQVDYSLVDSDNKITVSYKSNQEEVQNVKVHESISAGADVENASADVVMAIQQRTNHGNTVDSEEDNLKNCEVIRHIGCTDQKYSGVTETVCVKGARNKIFTNATQRDSLALLPSHKKRVPGRGRRTCQEAVSHGFLAVKESTEGSNGADLEQSSDASSSDTNDEDGSSVVKVEDIGMENDVMIRNSVRSIRKATIVKDSENVTIAHKAEVYHVHNPEKKGKGYNFKDQISNVVKSFRKKDHLFVETKAFHEVEQIIDDRCWALITGIPGDGKTAMAAHLLLKYEEKGFEPVIVTNAYDWKEMVRGDVGENQSNKQFVIIDDMFGSMSVDDKKVNEWISMIDIMERVVTERKGQLKVVCTSRSYVFNDVKCRIEKFVCFQNTSYVDLTQEKHTLTTDEKKQIWMNYTNEYDVSSHLPGCVSYSVMLPHGYPHCVELFCSNCFLRKNGVAFFENPMKYVCREIQNFKENDKIKYCLLLLILFNKNNLKESYVEEICLSDPPKDVIKLFKAAGLSSDHAQSELKKALTSLKNSYICEDEDNTYRFSHESIRENVAFIYIKDNPLHAIDDIDFRYLVDHTRMRDHRTEEQDNIFVLPLFCTSALIERTVKEIKNGYALLVCQHQAWENQLFVSKWLAYVFRQQSKTEANDVEAVLFTASTHISESSNVEITFLESLLFCNRKQAVIELLENAESKDHWNTELKLVISRALMFSCFILHSEDVITRLLQAGADVNFTMSAEDIKGYMFFLGHMFKPGIFSAVWNPLLCSVFAGNETLVQLFLSHGGQLFICGEPVSLIVAVQMGFPQIVEKLLEIKMPLSQSSLTASGDQQVTLAVWNCRFSRYVPQLKSVCRLTLAHVANDIDIVNILRQKGVGVNADVLVSGTRLPHCIYRVITGGLELGMFGALRQAGMEVTGTWMGETFLHYLIEYLSLLSYPTLSDLCLVLRAGEITKASIQCFELLPSLGKEFSLTSSINQTDKNGCSVLYVLFDLWSEDAVLAYSFQTMFIEMMRHGADVNLKDAEGITPGMLALANCTDMRTVMHCVKKRTAKLVDSSGRGYFHFLARSELPKRRLRKVVSALLQSGEDINLLDTIGNVPAFGCSSQSLLIFYQAGARIDAVNSFGQNILFAKLQSDIDEDTLEIFEMVKCSSSKFNANDSSGKTPMHCLLAAEADDSFIFERLFNLLLQMGCNPNSADKTGVTPLMLAAENAILDEDAFTFLLDHDIDISSIDSCNLSVLHYLVKGKKKSRTKVAILQKLLVHSANIFSLGRDILSFAVSETACAYIIIGTLLKYRNPSDDAHLAISLLMSNREHAEKLEYLTALIMSNDTQILIRDILQSTVLPRQMKTDVTAKFLGSGLMKPAELIVNHSDILEVLNRLNDEMTLDLFKQMSCDPLFESFLSDKRLHKALCKENFSKSLNFLITKGICMSGEGCERNILLNEMVAMLIVDEDLMNILTMLTERNIVISKGDKDILTPLHVACKTYPLKPMSTCMLMDNMDTVDQQDCNGMTALQYLCSSRTEKAAVVSHKFDVVVYLAFCLICKGADVDSQNLKGQTSIMAAIHSKPLNNDLLILLIENSKSINSRDTSGNTALHHLVRTSVRDDIKSSIVKLMLHKGADVTVANMNGQTCLSILQNQIGHKLVKLHVFSEFVSFKNLCNESDVLHIIFDHLAVTDENHESPEKLKHVIKKGGIDVNTKHNVHAKTMLMIACENMLPYTIRTLVSLNADLNVRDEIGCTCLTRFLYSKQLIYMSFLYCCFLGGSLHKERALQLSSCFWNANDTLEFLQAITDIEVRYSVGSTDCYRVVEEVNNKALCAFQTVLRGCVNPNLPDIGGKTPLHYFVESPLADIFICPAIQMLIDNGADVHSKDCEGMTPLMACSQYPGYKVRRLKILMAAGARITDVDNFGCDMIEYGKMAFGIKLKMSLI